jgi:hypothetical protein
MKYNTFYCHQAAYYDKNVCYPAKKMGISGAKDGNDRHDNYQTILPGSGFDFRITQYDDAEILENRILQRYEKYKRGKELLEINDETTMFLSDLGKISKMINIQDRDCMIECLFDARQQVPLKLLNINMEEVILPNHYFYPLAGLIRTPHGIKCPNSSDGRIQINVKTIPAFMGQQKITITKTQLEQMKKEHYNE